MCDNERDIKLEVNDSSDLEIVMRYTGWSKVMAQCAINQWKRYDPEWNAQYIKAYLKGVK